MTQISGEQKAVVADFPELCTPVLYSINFQIANWGTLDFTPTGSVVHPGVMIAGAGLRCGEDDLQTSRGVLQPPNLALHLGMTCSLSYYVLDRQHWHGLVASSGERIHNFYFSLL